MFKCTLSKIELLMSITKSIIMIALELWFYEWILQGDNEFPWGREELQKETDGNVREPILSSNLFLTD